MALPQALYLTIVLAVGPQSVTVGESKNVIHASRAHFAEANVDLKVNRIIKIRDKYAKYNKLESREIKLWLYRDLVNNLGYNRRNRTYVMLPPMIDFNGYKWVGGFAETSQCKQTGVAVGNALNTRTNGRTGIPMSAAALSHETGHLLGCRHESSENPPTLMHPNALAYLDTGISFSGSAVYRISRCLRSERKLGARL